MTTGSTNTNAQALAIDNISIAGVGGGDTAPTLIRSSSAGATNVPVDSTVVINFTESVFMAAAPSAGVPVRFPAHLHAAGVTRLDVHADARLGAPRRHDVRR